MVSLIDIDQLPAWALSFALGMTGAWAYSQIGTRWSRKVLERRALVALPALALVYAAFAYEYGRAGMELSGPITGSVARSDIFVSVGSTLTRAALMAAILLGPVALRRLFGNPLTKRVGEISYGLYLIHFVVLVYAASVLGRTDFSDPAGFALLCAIVLPVSLAYAYASRRWVEEPARLWVRRLVAREPLGEPDVPEPRRARVPGPPDDDLVAGARGADAPPRVRDAPAGVR